ncbi:MAG TPA: UbiX family flavin prenyltransferase [Mycobacteriales bacterium]|nr:UbiX family flavin prenyltransferase [Mycobacteriales bacterium]
MTAATGERPKRLVVAMTGASGSIIGVRLLEVLRDLDVETHFVATEWAERTLRIETDYSLDQVRALATHSYQPDNQAARISSGSFTTDGMVVAPCSMHTLAVLANGLADNLVARAFDVAMKERRRCVIVPRETPFSTLHLRHLLTLSELGVTVVPPVPAFYNKPSAITEVVDHVVARVLDQFGIDAALTQRWGEPRIHAVPPLAPRR